MLIFCFQFLTHAICLFFFHNRATIDTYTLSLHDALPISRRPPAPPGPRAGRASAAARRGSPARDRKSTRLNSSHTVISYAVFCLKKKISIIDLLELDHLASFYATHTAVLDSARDIATQIL